MEKRKESWIKRFLQLLSDEELKQLHSSFRKSELLEGVSRGFVIDKIQRDISDEEFLKSEYALRLVTSKLDQMISLIGSTLKRLEKADLIKICQDLGKEEIVTEEMKKSKIIKEMFTNIPVLELWRSKRLQERLKPKYISITHVKSLQKEVNALKNDVGYISNDIKFVSDRISLMSKDVKDLSTRLQSVEGMFSVGTVPDFQTYLKALYEEAIAMGEKPSPEAFRGISERLQKRLGIDERVFILKGIELLLAHYFLTQVKLLPWKPSLEEFWRIFKEEFEEVKIMEDQAEIPILRKHVCQRMGISDEMFDELLIEASKKDYVKLDVGRPIGEYDVKYLATKDGLKFYYVKLKR